MTIVLDRNLFKGNAALVPDGADAAQMLEAVNANFTVVPRAAEFGGRQFPQHQLWMRKDGDDFSDCLGCFGTARSPMQPQTMVQTMIDFCAQSEKDIKPDVIGCVGNGKTLYVASRLAGDTSDLHDKETYGDGGGMSIQRTVSKEDRTEHWLMQVVYFGQSLATKAFVFSNELKCSNGLALRTNEKRIVLRHKADNSHLVKDTLNQAIRSIEAYALMKDRFMHTSLDIAQGKQLIRQFHNDPDGESRVVKALERIYQYNLIGGDIPERQGNYWRLANAQTQYTSHNHISKEDPGKSTMSQLDGGKAKSNRDFLTFLESQFTSDRSAELVLA